MKIFLSLITILCMTTIVSGQAKDSVYAHKKNWHDHSDRCKDSSHICKKKYRMEHDVDINTTFFIKQILNFSSTSLEISPYIVGYKFFPVRNHGFRFAFGGNFSSSNQNPDSTFVQISKTGEIDYRVGYEYRHFFGKHWVFFAGVDFTNSFIWNTTKVNSSTDIITSSNNTWSLGGGPFVGIQVNFGKHISLFTETAFYYTYASTSNKVTSLNFPELNQNKVTDREQTGKFLLPTSLFFVFRF